MLASGLITAAITLGLFLIVCGVRYLLNQEGPGAFGLHLDRRGLRLFADGALVGALTFAAYPLVVVLARRGELRLEPEALGFTALLLGAWTLGYLATAVFEESLFRGYLLPKFLRRFPLPLAIALPSLLFGVIHLVNHEISPTFSLGIFNASLFGAVMAVAAIRTASVMWCIGCSLGWNLAQITLLSHHYSGEQTVANLDILQGRLAGTPYVPESGLIVTPITLALGAIVLLRFGRPAARAREGRPFVQTD